MSPSPEISVVLGSYNRRRFLHATLESLRDNGVAVPYETIVVDGGSTDGSVRWLTEQKDVVTIVQHNRGEFRGRPLERRSWGYFMNLALKSAQGRYLLMISDDCLLVPGAVMAGYRQFEAARAAGQPVVALAFPWRDWPVRDDYRVGHTLGHRMLVNHGMFLREAVEAIDWIDEERYRFYHADNDLALRLWSAGGTIEACPTAFVEHFSHANVAVRASNESVEPADRAALVERWAATFDDGGEWPRWTAFPFEDPHRTVRRFPRSEVLLIPWRRRLARARARLDAIRVFGGRRVRALLRGSR
jgi:hypothetical protein